MISHRLLSLLALYLSYLGFVAANEDNPAKKSNYQHYAITGVHTGVNPATGARPARMNILDMDAVTFALYIQALIEMQGAPESEVTSWYQVAGIHGRPYAAWDNVPHPQDAPPIGYCTHSSVLFPTWHRPYLALFEQILSNYCQTIAAQYPASIREQYITAASNFRIPYWDWASNPAIPNIVDSPTVTILTSSGVLKTVANPLYSWKFPSLDPKYFPSTQSSGAGDWYLALDSQTVRDPDTRTSPSDFIAADYNLENSNLQQATYYALTKSPSYNYFATQALPGPSIEAVHGQVHVDIGGEWGHMSELSYAAFDPVFWLHHCNVDRITALYQAMFPSSQNPNYFLTPYPEEAGTFALAITFYTGLNDTFNTPLEPFSTNSQGTFWTSQTAQHLSTFGYTYPEIQDWNQTPSELAANVTKQVNTLYGGQTDATPSKRSVTADGREQVIEWSAGISISRYQMNGQRFFVRLFVGDVPADPTTWGTNCVGSFAVLPPPQPLSGSAPDVTAYYDVSLVKALRSVGNDGQDVQTVVEYLTANFEWRVQLMNGTVVPENQYQTLEIVVQEEVVTLARNIYELPSYGEKTLHPEITQGKAGGYSG